MKDYFFFIDTPTTEIYTLPLHASLPILPLRLFARVQPVFHLAASTASKEKTFYENPALSSGNAFHHGALRDRRRSEEHTSELQSRQYLVCRLLLEKKNTPIIEEEGFFYV